MNSDSLFVIIVIFLCVEFVAERVLEVLNMRAMSPVLPDRLKGIYDEKEYGRFQCYKRETDRFARTGSFFSFIVLLVFLFLGGFGWYNRWIVSFTDGAVGQAVLFMWGVIWSSALLGLPFDWYATFRIEEKYGFNRSTLKLWWGDTLKSLALSTVIGGGIVAAVTAFYEWCGPDFWWYAWGVTAIFSLAVSMFYSRLIVPLFNKQIPLEPGPLRNKIESFVRKTGFKLRNIYVMDGSKRSTKANAYFSGFGPEKRIVLYDTLLHDLSEEEIVAVLAHEIGHYRKYHVLKAAVISVVQTGFMLWLFSLFVNIPAFSEALGGEKVYFQLGLVTFVLLYSPIATVTGIFMNGWSRRNEYEADAFVVSQGEGEALISGLKKISVKALSNLTPHPWYEFVYYSHPSLLKRIEAVRKGKH